MSIKKFRPYIEGYPFTLITDHSSLKWLMEQKDLTGRLARWSLKLQPYKFDIEYKKGSQNVVPDSLSRISMDEVIASVEMSLDINLDSEAFLEPDYIDRVKALEENRDVSSNYKVIDGKIYVLPGDQHETDDDTDIPSWKLVVPNEMTKQIIEQAHNPPSAAHQGIAKTLELIRRYFYWPSMVHQIRDFVKHCDICKASKAVNYSTQPFMGQAREVLRPFQRLFIDFLGPYPRTRNGFTHILILLDQYSRFPILEPLRTASAAKVTTFLENKIFHLYGVPETIFSDNGPQFLSHLFANLLEKYGIKHELTAKYSPQANASERVNRSILAAIRSYLTDDHRNWDQNLDQIAGALRNTTHSSTGFPPHYLIFGQHKICHGSHYQLLRKLNQLSDPNALITCNVDRLSVVQRAVLQNLKRAYERSSHNYNLRSRERVFTPGQEVFVRNFAQSDAAKKFSGKLAPKFLKAIISKRVGNVTYHVSDVAGKTLGVYHAKDIR